MAKKHKLTRRSLFNWAVRKAKAVPTYTIMVRDDCHGNFERSFPNTAQHELALLLHSNYNAEICEYEVSELREYLSDMAWDGTVGWSTMDVEALLDELFDMCESYGFGDGDTVEDVVAHCSR